MTSVEPCKYRAKKTYVTAVGGLIKIHLLLRIYQYIKLPYRIGINIFRTNRGYFHTIKSKEALDVVRLLKPVVAKNPL